MEGISHISGASNTIDRLRHMYSHCYYRFNSNIGCKFCKYNTDDKDNSCVLLEISDRIRDCTEPKPSGNSLIRLVE